ncbi:hypothetical protein ACFX13_008128 [Malus domestica]
MSSAFHSCCCLTASLSLKNPNSILTSSESSESEKSNHHHRYSLCAAAGRMPLSGLSEEKTRGSKVWSLQPQQTGTVDGDKNCDRTTFSGGWSSESRTAEQLRVGVGVREQSQKLEPTRRQLDAEKKKQTKGPRVESLNPMTHYKITILEQMMLHCYYYREIYPDIWISCIESLGPWILSYPSLVLQGVYFMYLGLTLNGNSAGVREASVHALKNLYEVDDNAPNLGRFTRRFSSQRIGLAGDFDISVAISAIGLVKQLLRHQLLPPEIGHVIGALEYEHLIAQVFNSSQFGAKGFSCHDHGTINIAYRGENFICVGVDSKLTNALTGHVTDLTCNKFYRLSRNIYITMAGFRMAWEEMRQWMTSVFQTIPEESHTVELAANLAYHFVSPYGTVCSLVLGWDFTSPHPQMFRVIPGISLTSDSAMAVGSGEEHINLRDLTDYNYGELAHAFHNTMLLLNQACLLDPFCGGIVIGRVLQRNQPPSCQYLNFFY